MRSVLHVLDSAKIGGIEKLVLHLAECQLNEGRHVAILFLLEDGKGQLLPQYQALNTDLHFTDMRSGYDISTSVRKRMRLIFSKFDIIHLHNFNFAVFLSLCREKKAIYTEHGNFGFGRAKKWSDYVKSLLKKHFLNSRVDVITFNSLFTQKKARSLYKLRGVKQFVIYNGVKLSSFENHYTSDIQSIKKKVGKRFVVGTTSRFAGFKRIELLIEAFSEFHQSRSDSVLLLVGEGDQRSFLESLVDLYDIQSSVIFTGFKLDIQQYQNIMDVCVFSSFCEAFGLVAVECLALGKPVLVCKDGGGIVEIIDPLCPEDVVDSPHQMAKRLEYYCSKRATSDMSLARQARAGDFQIDVMTEKLSKIYFSV